MEKNFMCMNPKDALNVVRNAVQKTAWMAILWMVFVGVPSNSFAFDEWSKRDYTLQATWTVLHIVDWGQTLDIAKNSDKFHENNPFIGERPSVSKVNLYMGSSTIINPLITHVLPSKWRPYFQGLSIGVTTGCVVNNYRLGLNINF